jgi:hypothetical protein
MESTIHDSLPFEIQWASETEMDFLLEYLIFDLTTMMLKVAVELKH